MADKDTYRISENRPLTDEERTLLEWLLSHGFTNASGYVSQLPIVTGSGRCTCGCPTIFLAVEGKEAFGASEIIAEAEGRSPEGIPVGVILHCREGQLSELEVYPIPDIEEPFALPATAALVATRYD